MASIIQNLLDGIVGDGARSTKFECLINLPGSDLFQGQNNIVALVKTSQFPGKTHDSIDLKFKGRTIPVKGQTKYDNTWSCTFYMTKTHALKKAFEDWMESIDQQHNIKTTTEGIEKTKSYMNDNGYTVPMKIYQLDFENEEQTVTYELFNCFPKSVSAVDVDYSSVGDILEFTVEFSYSYFDTTIETIEPGLIESLKTAAYETVTDAFSKTIGKIGNPIAINSFEINSSIAINSETYSSPDSMLTIEDWDV